MYALQENARQMRITAPAQIPGARISVCHGVGGMSAASGTIIMSNEGRRVRGSAWDHSGSLAQLLLPSRSHGNLLCLVVTSTKRKCVTIYKVTGTTGKD